MKKAILFLSLVLLAPVVALAPAGAQQRTSGSFTMSVHTHSSTFGSPTGAPTLFQTAPLSTAVAQGSEFSYSSISCSTPAPFNDRSLDFTPNVPGVSDPASTRHLIEGTVEFFTSGGRGYVTGTITTILCRNGQDLGDRIFFSFRGELRRTSANDLQIRGAFRITGGRGIFADISGSGSINGSLTCLPPILAREGASSCADLGAFSDAVLFLDGVFSDPTT